MYVAAVAIPWFMSLFKIKSTMIKLGTAYLIFSCLDAFYDMGVYTHFFFHGPRHIRRLIDLPQEKNFGPIQMRLFMRYCATKEIKKATGETKKKGITELVFFRSLKNQLRD